MFKWSKLWPWSSVKEVPKQEPDVSQPPVRFIKEFAEGVGNCGAYIPYQYANWCYEYLGMEGRVFIGEMVLNKHIVYMTQACIQYVEDNPE